MGDTNTLFLMVSPLSFIGVNSLLNFPASFRKPVCILDELSQVPNICTLILFRQNRNSNRIKSDNGVCHGG